MKLLGASFRIFTERGAKPHIIRFVGAPYKTNESECRHMLIATHHRGTEMVSPLSIAALLNKFEISEDQFRGAYNDFCKGLIYASE